MSVYRNFVLPPDFNVKRISAEFNKFVQNNDALTPQNYTKEECPWATGWIQIGQDKLNVYLENSLIDKGETSAEIEIVRLRDGRSDSYKLKITEERKLSSTVEKAAEELLTSFIKHINAKTFKKSFSWADY